MPVPLAYTAFEEKQKTAGITPAASDELPRLGLNQRLLFYARENGLLR